MASVRQERRRSVAYSSGSPGLSEPPLTTCDIYSLSKTADSSDASQSADAVLLRMRQLVHDSFGQKEPDFTIFEAFSKLDSTSSLERRTQVAVRIVCTEDRTCGFRVLAFSLNKDHRYGSKVGYKKVPIESYSDRDHQLTENFINLCQDLVLEISFHEGPEGLMIRASGQVKDDPYRCQTLVEFCQAKDRKPQFRMNPQR